MPKCQLRRFVVHRVPLIALSLLVLLLQPPLVHAQPQVTLRPKLVAPENLPEPLVAELANLTPRTTADLSRLQSEIRSVFLKALPATVAIQAGAAHGCGVIVTPEGHVLTAAHVAGWPGRSLTLRLQDGRRVNAQTLGMNHKADSALVQILDTGPWPFLEVGRSDDVTLGQWCLALGYPGGHRPGIEPALRVGRVLAENNSHTALLTDCTLIGGDSGGPLLNLEGKVIGVNSRIGADLAANLHVPVDEYRRNRDRYLNSESWGQDGYLGVARAPGSRDQDRAVVYAAEAESPAARSGLRKGDEIVRFNGHEVDSYARLQALERVTPPGQAVIVIVKREQQEHMLRVTVAQSPTPAHSEEDAQLLESFLRQAGWRQRAIDTVGKNHRAIKQAARDAVQLAKASAVRVFANHQPVALGTVVSQDGYILTKASEVRQSSRPVCRLFDGRRLPARIVAQDWNHDLALLKVEAHDLVPIDWSTDSEPLVGTWLASASTTSEPLLVGNVSGPATSVRKEGALLGIRMKRLQPGDVAGPPEVDEVIRGSAAESAGLIPGDVIRSVNEQTIVSQDDLRRRISAHWPGESVSLSIRRAERDLDLPLVLGRESDSDEDMNGFREFSGGNLSIRRSGFPLVFRHDSALQPNFCGGPVLNLDGRCVGINIARADRVASYALPSMIVREVLDRLLQQSGSEGEVATVSVPRTDPARSQSLTSQPPASVEP